MTEAGQGIRFWPTPSFSFDLPGERQIILGNS